MPDLSKKTLITLIILAIIIVLIGIWMGLNKVNTKEAIITGSVAEASTGGIGYVADEDESCKVTPAYEDTPLMETAL